MDWWLPAYALPDLGMHWNASLEDWIGFLNRKTEMEIMETVQFTGHDGERWEARLFDIALQLVYHSIHHRAQIQTLIRKQGMEPDFIDYIGTRYRKIS